MKTSANSAGPLIEVRNSPVHGSGVFALRKIRKGTRIIEYLGDRISHDAANERYEGHDPHDNHTFLFTVDKRTVIDAGVDGNDARFINHSCDPNCESETEKRRVFIDAIKTIQPGEELNYDYSISRDDDDAANVDEIFACRCGAATCRGSMLEPRKDASPKKRRKTAAKSASKSPARRGGTGKSKGKSKRKGKGSGKSKAKPGHNGPKQDAGRRKRPARR